MIVQSQRSPTSQGIAATSVPSDDPRSATSPISSNEDRIKTTNSRSGSDGRFSPLAPPPPPPPPSAKKFGARRTVTSVSSRKMSGVANVLHHTLFGSGVREDSWIRTPEQRSIALQLSLLRVFVLASCLFSFIVNISQQNSLGSQLSFWQVGKIESDALRVTLVEGQSTVDGSFTVGIGIKGVSLSLSTDVYNRQWVPFQNILDTTTPGTLKGCCDLFVSWRERAEELADIRREGGGALVIQWAAEAFTTDALGLGIAYEITTGHLDTLFPYSVVFNVIAVLLVIKRAWRPCAFMMLVLAGASLLAIVLWEYFVLPDTRLRFEDQTMTFARGPGEILTGCAAVWSLICAFVCMYGENLEQQARATTMLKKVQGNSVTMFDDIATEGCSMISQEDAAHILGVLRLPVAHVDVHAGLCDGQTMEDCQMLNVTKFDLCKHIELTVKNQAKNPVAISDNPRLQKHFGL